MAIHRLFRYAAFDPEDVKRIASAYDEALITLALPNDDDPVTRLVAEKIIEIAQRGELDPRRLSKRTISELGVPDTS